ncbi:hypothetical protein ACTXT7_007038 [Hymenolepis weldensis]
MARVDSGYFMDVSKHDEDESSELFGIPSQSQNWNACPSQSLNAPTPGHNTSISSNFPDSRFLRLSNDFQEAEDLQASFGDLNTSEDVSTGQYCFSRPAERVATQVDDFEEENGFDSGFGSLQLTPTEIHSEGVCDSNSPQPPLFWRNSTKESRMECEEQNFSSSFNPQISSQQSLQLKRCSLMVEYETLKIDRDGGVFSPRANSRAPSNSTQDGIYLSGVRPLPQPYRQISRNSRNALYQMSATPAFTKPLISQMPQANNTFSSSSSSPYLYEMSRSAPSPVSHRNLNKRVAQQEASEFLSCSEGGNWDENFDDIDSFGIETDFDDVVFPSSVERSSPQVSSSSHGGYRNCLSFPLRRGQYSPLSRTNHRRSRSTALSATSIERPRKVGGPRNGGRKRNLLNFILELLTTRQNCVEWVDKPKQVFQIVNPDQLTRLWGEHKNNIKMSFDSLSRSLRLYYKPGKLERIPGTRHQYRLIHKPPECSDLLCKSSYGCNSDHRKSNTSMNYSNSLKQQSVSQKPYL